MAIETLKKYSEELKSAREVKQITLQQIANKTKIDIKFLQAIENANFDLLPELYIKAFIKEYSQLVDLDIKETIKKFDLAKKGLSEQPEKIEPVQLQAVEPKLVEETKKEFDLLETSTPTVAISENEQKKSYTSSYVFFAVIGLLVIALLYFLFIRNSAPDIVTERQVDGVTNSGGPRFEVADQNANQSQTPEQLQPSNSISDSLRIRLLTTAKVWIKVLADGKIVNQQTVPSDTKLNYSAIKSFSVSVGNAGFVKLYFNNKLIENLGKSGEIRNVFLSTDTIRFLTIAPQPKNENKSKTTN
jgi:cytoskeleton protein RodZ